MLGTHRGAPNHKDVHTGVHHRLDVFFGALRRERAGHRDAQCTQFGNPRSDQVRPDGCGIELLQHRGSSRQRHLRDLGQRGFGLLVTRPESLQVEHRQGAERADLRRRRGRDH